VPTTQDKRQGLMEAGEELFSKFGARRTTVEEVCRAAGVSKMTFYKHFRNKVALVKAIIDNRKDESFRQFDAIKAMNIPFADKIELMMKCKAEFDRRLGAEYIRELVSTDEAVEEFKTRYVANIRAAQLRGEVRSDVDPGLLWLVIEKLDDLVKDGRWEKVSQNQAQFQERLSTLLWLGLRTP